MLLSEGRFGHAVAKDENREVCRQLVGAFNFQNAYGIDGCAPYQHKIKMGFDGHALMLPVNLKLGQNIQAQRGQRLG